MDAINVSDVDHDGQRPLDRTLLTWIPHAKGHFVVDGQSELSHSELKPRECPERSTPPRLSVDSHAFAKVGAVLQIGMVLVLTTRFYLVSLINIFFKQRKVELSFICGPRQRAPGLTR